MVSYSCETGRYERPGSTDDQGSGRCHSCFQFADLFWKQIQGFPARWTIWCELLNLLKNLLQRRCELGLKFYLPTTADSSFPSVFMADSPLRVHTESTLTVVPHTGEGTRSWGQSFMLEKITQEKMHMLGKWLHLQSASCQPRQKRGNVDGGNVPGNNWIVGRHIWFY